MNLARGPGIAPAIFHGTCWPPTGLQSGVGTGQFDVQQSNTVLGTRPRIAWEERLVRLFGRLVQGDVLVVTNVHALGRDTDEETRTLAELARRGVVVKVLRHGARHLYDAF